MEGREEKVERKRIYWEELKVRRVLLSSNEYAERRGLGYRSLGTFGDRGGYNRSGYIL